VKRFIKSNPINYYLENVMQGENTHSPR